MYLRKYYLTVGLMALLLSPVVISIGLICGLLFNSSVMLITLPVLALALVWAVYTRRGIQPGEASEVFFPILLVFCYYMCVWIIAFGLSKYRFDSNLFYNFYFILAFPNVIINFFVSFSGGYSLLPFVTIGITAVTVLTIIITRAISHDRIRFDKRAIIYVLVIVCLSGVALYQHYDRSTKILDSDYQAERIEDEVDLSRYHPFRENNLLKGENNLLKTLDETAAVSFEENYPRLDGATAAYPVYSAMAQALYKGLNESSVEKYVACSKTDEAYERLIRGEIDIFFGAQPSAGQIESAKENGIDFTLTPIAREAFVFFVNRGNPVSSLTLGQIQDIYQKKITNWNSVGGYNEKIMPFQRPVDSGSQTIMLAMVMRDKALPAPLWEEYATGMGGMISRVAEYRNYSSAIGYSFRYFATGMKPNENIKLLAIDGVEPTIENIRNCTYPFTIDVYAVTAGVTTENTDKLIDWVLSEQGQRFIETCGYVKVR